MTEKDTGRQLKHEEQIALGLIGALRKEGACDLELLDQIFRNLKSDNAFCIALKSAVADSKLPDKNIYPK
ncbi:hypothetical protein COS55_01805 [Candidatus Shapirobacteria bacterium CG03_land_8_20_14_0_80_40_19]|uniref:Uncharacterized protein n=2 Tax=Candidatus Shapironibacteriota TaxID=1752721 RepID=A0A2M7BE70_9BACT|nr:MAG: hypothetical protein COS55_01805 [Candidatus Shapirobacteria bacterium CG03_land_8_20_14_0_80_40_19]PJC29018.1 MAG: hypothetical protein CO053_01630 [Candidatus Shapirobacteria bacterium CG_4_9_14_0_2_um_filter_40_11]